VLLVAALAACNDDTSTTAPTTTPPPPPPAPAVLLKDIIIPNLPAPYYHFEYDATGRASFASFASDFFRYDLTYDGGRLSEMRNNILVNHDELKYVYDEAGRVVSVRYVGADDAVFTVLFFTYTGEKLTGIERDRRVTGGFIIDKRTTLSYYPDGNLMDLTIERPKIDGVQDATTTVDHFERYDTGINVDAFGLLHDEFFDHVVLLPGVQLQTGNPARQTHTGSGTTFVVDFSYTYDARHLPLAKNESFTFTNGSEAGRKFQATTVFSYY